MGGATKEYEGGGVVCTAVELLHHTRYRSRNRLRWATALSEVKEKVSSLSLVLACLTNLGKHDLLLVNHREVGALVAAPSVVGSVGAARAVPPLSYFLFLLLRWVLTRYSCFCCPERSPWPERSAPAPGTKWAD